MTKPDTEERESKSEDRKMAEELVHHLGSCSNGHAFAVIVVGGGTGLVQMGTQALRWK